MIAVKILKLKLTILWKIEKEILHSGFELVTSYWPDEIERFLK